MEQRDTDAPRIQTHRYPDLGRQIEQSIAMAIDGEIFSDAYLVRLNPESEIYLIRKSAEGGLRWVILAVIPQADPLGAIQRSASSQQMPNAPGWFPRRGVGTMRRVS